MSGYIHGDSAAAKYCGVSRKTFWRWQNDRTVNTRGLLAPRIIKGKKVYSKQKIDTFMDPALNGAAVTKFQGVPFKSPKQDAA